MWTNTQVRSNCLQFDQMNGHPNRPHATLNPVSCNCAKSRQALNKKYFFVLIFGVNHVCLAFTLHTFVQGITTPLLVIVPPNIYTTQRSTLYLSGKIDVTRRYTVLYYCVNLIFEALGRATDQHCVIMTAWSQYTVLEYL